LLIFVSQDMFPRIDSDNGLLMLRDW